jgi:PKD repeat protein
VKRVILSVTLVIALLAASNAEAAGARKIVLSTDATGAELEGLCLINGCGVVQHLPFIDGIVITLPPKASEKALAALLAHNKVILIEDDVVVQANKPKIFADFSASPTGGSAPLVVQFTNLSGGGLIKAHYWEFGDGATSTAKDPVHTYSTDGSYSVTLTVTGPLGSAVKTETDYIVVEAAGPVVLTAGFAANPTSGEVPLTVQFTDTSTGSPSSWLWDFGDGATSAAQNPSHEYQAVGNYTVSLTVEDGTDVSTETKVDFISVSEPPPLQPLPWGINRIDAEWAWGAITGAGVNVAIVDTGRDYEHPDLAANYTGGYNAINPRKSPKDDDRDASHGTHCAGIVAALNNEIGVVGVAPGAGLYAVKVLDRTGSGWVSDIIEGIDWCIEKGDISVISMSLGADVVDEIVSFRQAVQRAAAVGIVVVCAAGNHNPLDPDPGVSQPARYAEAIAVAATGDYQTGTPSDGLASFSNTGPEVDIAAPGVAIYSTMRGGTYGNLNGTSMACPHVTGVVALMLQAGRSIDFLFSTADNIGLSPAERGAGLVDAEEAATGNENGKGLND